MIGITGSTGTLGSILKEYLNDRSLQYIEFKGDILKKNELNNWLSINRFSHIFHFAAKVPVDYVDRNKDHSLAVNVIGTSNLLEGVALICPKAWIFYASTSHVYQSKSEPLKESDHILPLNFYGLTKYYGERLVYYFRENHKLKICTGRIFSFYSYKQEKPFLYPSIKEKLEILKNDVLEVYGSKNIRDISEATSIIHKIFMLSTLNYTGVVNIGSGISKTISDFIKEVFKLENIDIKDMGNYQPTSIVASTKKFNDITKKIIL